MHDDSSITSKRKRSDTGDDRDDIDTPTKRSNLEKGLIPDSFDTSSQEGCLDRSDNVNGGQKLTPMKRSTAFAAIAAPKNTAGGVSFQSSNLSPKHGATLGSSPSPLASSALSPLIRPRISDYISTPEPGVDGSIVSNALSPLMNIETSSDSIHGGEYPGGHTTSGEKQNTPPPTHTTITSAQDQELNIPGLPTPQPTPQKNSTTTTTITPLQKPVSKLHSTPPIAPAYVPEYISTNSPVKMKDPKQFCVRPPFWRRWPTYKYSRLATFLQETINLVPFAEQEDLTVEEVQHVFHAVVTEPLLDETEKLADVGAKRMAGIFKLLNREVGLTKWRTWESEVSSVKGEVCGVRPGVVQLVGEEGQLIEVPFMKLGRVDFEFVLKTVTSEERGVLLREVTSD